MFRSEKWIFTSQVFGGSIGGALGIRGLSLIILFVGLLLFTSNSFACLRMAKILTLTPESADNYGFSLEIKKVFWVSNCKNCVAVKVIAPSEFHLGEPSKYNNAELSSVLFSTYFQGELISKSALLYNPTLNVHTFSYYMSVREQHRQEIQFNYGPPGINCTYYSFTLEQSSDDSS